MEKDFKARPITDPMILIFAQSFIDPDAKMEDVQEKMVKGRYYLRVKPKKQAGSRI